MGQLADFQFSDQAGNSAGEMDVSIFWTEIVLWNLSNTINLEKNLSKMHFSIG